MLTRPVRGTRTPCQQVEARTDSLGADTRGVHHTYTTAAQATRTHTESRAVRAARERDGGRHAHCASTHAHNRPPRPVDQPAARRDGGNFCCATERPSRNLAYARLAAHGRAFRSRYPSPSAARASRAATPGSGLSRQCATQKCNARTRPSVRTNARSPRLLPVRRRSSPRRVSPRLAFRAPSFRPNVPPRRPPTTAEPGRAVPSRAEPRRAERSPIGVGAPSTRYERANLPRERRETARRRDDFTLYHHRHLETRRRGSPTTPSSSSRALSTLAANTLAPPPSAPYARSSPPSGPP